MMEYTLEDDIPEEFKGGTLQFRDEKSPNAERSPEKSPGGDGKNDKTSLDNEKEKVGEVPDKNKLNVENNNSMWKSSLMIPLSELTECIWNRKSISPSEKSTDVQPSIASLVEENATNFFTFRDGVVDKAVKECAEQLLDTEADGPLINVFLLTEIHFWDTDKERLILLTPNSIVVVKYDFIALKRVECRKIFLKEVDSALIGDLVYPSKSLVPNRNMYGIRLLWNKNQPLNFGTKWNPFSSKIPFATFTSHPLLYHKDNTSKTNIPDCVNDSQRKLYDIREFIEAVCNVLTDIDARKINNDSPCIIHHKDILLENYVSIGSIIHNRNALGYFKVRGKFSF